MARRIPAPPPPADPLAQVLDALARRWSLPAVMSLAGGAAAFNVLRAQLGNPPESVLAQRLAELRELRVCEVVPESGEWRLSSEGRRLLGVLDAMRSWAETRR
jgi:DNA-binding HxlR family transcriptional regulator